MRSLAVALSALSLAALLTGCDLFGGESSEAANARREAEGKAVGSACRHAMRAIEDCYTLNPKALKSAVFAGWREMDEYMRENKIDGIAPTIVRPAKDKEGAADGKEEGRSKSAKAGKSGKSKGDKAEKMSEPARAEPAGEPTKAMAEHGAGKSTDATH